MNRNLPVSFMLFIACHVCASDDESPRNSIPLKGVPVQAQSVDEVISVVAASSNVMFLQPSPVQRIDGSELVEFGSLNLRDILSELPAVSNEGAMASSASDNTGLNYVDLRHLGAKRTLVLVNGKRQVAGSPDAMQLDLSTIPVALIDYIDVVTGGAAATYGADAISGVINIHMKDSFVGHEMDLFGASSLHGDFAGQSGGSYLFGRDFSAGRGNVNVYVSVEQTDNVMASDLQQFEQWGMAYNGDGQLGPLDARFVWMPHMINPYISRTSVINGETFAANGESALLCESQIQGPSTGYFPQGCDYGFYNEQYTTFMPDSEQWLVSTTINYDLSDDMQWTGELKFSQSNNTQRDIANLFQTNAYLGVSDEISNTDTPQVSDDVYLAKLFDEFGEHYLANNRQMMHISSSISGSIDFSHSIADYELYLLYGENESSQTTYNKAHLAYLALAAQMVLADEKKFDCNRLTEQFEGEVPCIEYPFNGFNLADESIKNQLKDDLTDDKKIKLMAFGGVLSTDSSAWFEPDFLPSFGPVDIQIGFEWRKEEYGISIENPTSNAEITSIPPKLDQSGQIITTESFVDLAIPVYVSDDSNKQLHMNTSIRWVNYSHIGNDMGWQIGFNYQASSNWFWRATIERAVRGPNLVESYNKGVDSSVFLVNPCTNGKLNVDENGQYVCIPHSGLNIAATWVDSNISGGGDTEAEQSTAKTLGVAWSHDDADVLGISLDYFEYSINNAILDIDAQSVFNNCYQFTKLEDNQYCDRIEMDNNFGMPTMVRGGFINAASMDLAGVDANITHQSTINWFEQPVVQQWRFNISNLLQLDKYEFLRAPDLVNLERGEVGDPKWQVRVNASFVYGQWTIDWASRYIHRTSNIEITDGRETGLEAYPYHVGSITTSDMVLGYVSDSGYQLNLGVRNIFNKVPPGYIDDFSYDLVGRRVFAQMNYGF